MGLADVCGLRVFFEEICVRARHLPQLSSATARNILYITGIYYLVWCDGSYVYTRTFFVFLEAATAVFECCVTADGIDHMWVGPGTDSLVCS